MSAFRAFSSILSSSWKSMARLVLPSRLELKRPEGSSNEAPLVKVSFTTLLYVSPVQMIPACDHTGPPSTERRRAGSRAGQRVVGPKGKYPLSRLSSDDPSPRPLLPRDSALGGQAARTSRGSSQAKEACHAEEAHGSMCLQCRAV